MTKKTIEQAYEELRQIIDGGSESFTHDDAVQYLKDKLAQPEQEPVAYCNGMPAYEGPLSKTQRKEPEQEEYLSKAYRLANELRCHLAIAPAPQRTWVGLTDEEKQEWIDAMPYDPQPRHCMTLVNIIESKLKENNT